MRFAIVSDPRPRQPRRMNEYLYEGKPHATFARIAAVAHADVILCGHTHRPYDKDC